VNNYFLLLNQHKLIIKTFFSLCRERCQQVLEIVNESKVFWGGLKSDNVTIATYPLAGERGEIQKVHLSRRKTRGVVTNVYSRKTLVKPKDEGLCVSKIRFGSCLRTGKVLAPHAPVTRDDSL